MLFSSIPFLYYFLPIFFLCYAIAPKTMKNGIIFFGSLFFYGCGEPENLILMGVSILTGYLGGIFISRGKKKKVWLGVSVTILLAFLGYFKYANFFLENIHRFTGADVPVLKVVLPIGISFYTFQIVSYLVDIYRGDIGVQRNFITFGAYVVLFPQLIAGPIVRCRDVAKALAEREHTPEKVYEGLGRFLAGLGKKILIANAMAQICDVFRESQEKSVVFYWMYAVSFAIFIYFDFSGYSDMAIGLGRMMGFHFPENFNYPYLSGSITEFWRRWHMTLGSWFRDYVYIPLGGNRVKTSRWLLNMLLVWICTGLWHGAAWNFVLWGLLFAVLLVVEKLTGFHQKIPRMISHIYVWLVLLVSFVIFNGENLVQALQDVQGCFGFLDVPFVTAETLYYLKSYAMTLWIAVIGCTPLPKLVFEKSLRRWPRITESAKLMGLVMTLLLATAYLIDGSFNPFLYFRF